MGSRFIPSPADVALAKTLFEDAAILQAEKTNIDVLIAKLPVRISSRLHHAHGLLKEAARQANFTHGRQRVAAHSSDKATFFYPPEPVGVGVEEEEPEGPQPLSPPLPPLEAARAPPQPPASLSQIQKVHAECDEARKERDELRKRLEAAGQRERQIEAARAQTAEVPEDGPSPIVRKGGFGPSTAIASTSTALVPAGSSGGLAVAITSHHYTLPASPYYDALLATLPRMASSEDDLKLAACVFLAFAHILFTITGHGDKASAMAEAVAKVATGLSMDSDKLNYLRKGRGNSAMKKAADPMRLVVAKVGYAQRPTRGQSEDAAFAAICGKDAAFLATCSKETDEMEMAEEMAKRKEWTEWCGYFVAVGWIHPDGRVTDEARVEFSRLWEVAAAGKAAGKATAKAAKAAKAAAAAAAAAMPSVATVKAFASAVAGEMMPEVHSALGDVAQHVTNSSDEVKSVVVSGGAALADKLDDGLESQAATRAAAEAAAGAVEASAEVQVKALRNTQRELAKEQYLLLQGVKDTVKNNAERHDTCLSNIADRVTVVQATVVAEAHEKAVAAEKETQAAAERELLPRRMLSARAAKENLAPWR